MFEKDNDPADTECDRAVLLSADVLGQLDDHQRQLLEVDLQTDAALRGEHQAQLRVAGALSHQHAAEPDPLPASELREAIQERLHGASCVPSQAGMAGGPVKPGPTRAHWSRRRLLGVLALTAGLLLLLALPISQAWRSRMNDPLDLAQHDRVMAPQSSSVVEAMEQAVLHEEALASADQAKAELLGGQVVLTSPVADAGAKAQANGVGLVDRSAAEKGPAAVTWMARQQPVARQPVARQAGQSPGASGQSQAQPPMAEMGGYGGPGAGGNPAYPATGPTSANLSGMGGAAVVPGSQPSDYGTARMGMGGMGGVGGGGFGYGGGGGDGFGEGGMGMPGLSEAQHGHQPRRETLAKQGQPAASQALDVDAMGVLATPVEGRYQPTPDQSRFARQSGRIWHRDGHWLYEPRPQAPRANHEQYDMLPENPFVPVSKQALSTFSIDVDTASYANVRRFLTQNQLPPAAAVRVEELINYFSYDYAGPEDDQPFASHLEVTECPWQPQHRLVRVGLQGQAIAREERPGCNLVFLLDVSGSMKDANKLPLLKQAMKLLVDQLDEDDRVAIVTYASQAGVRLKSTVGDQHQVIREAIDGLNANGSTNGGAGIQMAYEQALAGAVEGGVNRVILATDGDLNVGITDDDALVRLIKEKAASDVFLTVLGFGEGNLKDAKLEKLADNGNGLYAYIDNLREARKVLVEQVEGSLVTIAKDVKIKVEFNPAEVQAYRLIGYENRLMTAPEFDDDKKDAGEIGAGHAVTALYEIVPAAPVEVAAVESLKYQQAASPIVPAEQLTDAAKTGELLTLSLRYKLPDADESTLIEIPLLNARKRFSEATMDFRFATAVASFGMLLRDSVHRGDTSFAAVEEIAAAALGDDESGYRTEFLDLVRRAATLK